MLADRRLVDARSTVRRRREDVREGVALLLIYVFFVAALAWLASLGGVGGVTFLIFVLAAYGLSGVSLLPGLCALGLDNRRRAVRRLSKAQHQRRSRVYIAYARWLVWLAKRLRG